MFRFFSKLIAPQRKLFIYALLALVLASGCNMLLPQLARQALSQNGILSLYDNPISSLFVFILFFSAQGIFFYFRSSLFGSLGIKVVADIRQKIFANLLNQEMEFFDRQHSGEFVSRLSADLQLVQEMVGQKLSVLIRYSLQGVIGIVLMFLLSKSLAVTGIIILAPLIILSALIGRSLKKVARTQQESVALASATAQEIFSGIKIIKVFNRYLLAMQKYGETISDIVQQSNRRVKIAAFMQSFVTFLLHSAFVALIYIGITRTTQGLMPLGDLIAFLLYGIIVAISFAFLLGAYTDVLHAQGAAERIFELLNAQLNTSEKEHNQKTISFTKGHVRFDNVSFAYPTRPQNKIFKDLSFSLEAGVITALVGESGGGKSALTELMLRLYQPTSGKIFFDDVDIATIPSNVVRASIGWVPQDATLFAGDLRENLLIGDPNATEKEILSALEKVNLLSFIDSLPDKLSTKIGERGVQLSGGQKQRLAIARVFLKDPLIYIFDEITSALDAENEMILMDELLPQVKGKTVLMITHREATVARADKILRLVNGKIG